MRSFVVVPGTRAAILLARWRRSCGFRSARTPVLASPGARPCRRTGGGHTLRAGEQRRVGASADAGIEVGLEVRDDRLGHRDVTDACGRLRRTSMPDDSSWRFLATSTRRWRKSSIGAAQPEQPTEAQPARRRQEHGRAIGGSMTSESPSASVNVISGRPSLCSAAAPRNRQRFLAMRSPSAPVLSIVMRSRYHFAACSGLTLPESSTCHACASRCA